MSSVDAAGLSPASSRKSEWALASVRPVTLLIASGIILVAAILIVTGVVAEHLREQAVATTEAGLTQLDAVLAEAGGRSLRAVDDALGDIARRTRSPDGLASEGADALAVAALLRSKLDAVPGVVGLALADAGGNLVARAGNWPDGEASVAARDYFTALRAHPAVDVALGAPAAGPLPYVSVARALRGAHGEFAGIAVATIAAGEFDGFYRKVPLGADGIVSLVRRDGIVLAQYPPQPGELGRPIAGDRLRAALAETSTGAVDDDRRDRQWRIATMQAIAGFPAVVVVSRGGDAALDDWSRQTLLFAAFAVCGAVAIALMVYLIARQFRAHGALAAMRAEKIESEHARLFAEAELLKKERLSVLGQLTATVAHELRNPLSAIRNTLFTLKEITGSGSKLDRPIARMERSIERCDRIIGDLLEYARNRDLRRAEVTFDAWLAETLAEHPLPAGIRLVAELRAGSAAVPLDPDRIRRVVINLVDNAAQALAERPPGADSRITVRTAIDGDQLELAVEDTGPGISPENLSRIFEPLFSTKSFGTGLGLATVRQIITQHDGRIGVRSEVGAGTAFTVRLPLRPKLEEVA